TRARDRAEAAAPRRADRRHEPPGDGGVHRVCRGTAHRARPDGADDRARHARRDEHLRSRHGPRLRRQDRRGVAGGRSEGPARDRGLPRQTGARGARTVSAQPQTVLELEDVHTYYGSIQALKGISLTVNQGEIVTLIGANGAGKSTTLRSINGLNN